MRRIRPALLLTAVAFSALCCGVRACARPPLKPDAGKYIIEIQETYFGTDTFTADADGGADSDIAYSQVGAKARLHVKVQASGGTLKSIEAIATPGGRFRLTVDGGRVRLGSGETDEQDLRYRDASTPQPIFPYCTAAPEQFRLVLAAYDLRQGGTQTFHVVYSNALRQSELIQGELMLTLLAARPMIIGGRSVPIVRYRVGAPGSGGVLGADLYADSDGRILMFRIASQSLLVVRDGYQALKSPETAADPVLSPPTFAVKVERNARVRMRDGVALAADIYAPDAPGRFPVILQRTCYGRQNSMDAAYYARRGYVFVAQDVRGKFDSEGDWRPWVNEARDGSDTLEWCAQQKWSNGNIGMIGASYLAYVQWAAAKENNRRLKCLIPIAAPPDPFYNFPYAFGPLALDGAVWWSGVVEGKSTNGPVQHLDLEALKTLPVNDVDKGIFGRHIDFLQEWMRHPNKDAYWEQASFNDHMRGMPPIPALHVSGWFDPNGIGTKRNFQMMVAAGHKNQKLVYGPWSHIVDSGTRTGPLDFGARSVRDLDTLCLRWFDRWLKGIKNGVDEEPPVDAFLMGINDWRTFSAWPPKMARATRWYLHSAGHANSDGSDGRLSTDPPGALEPADHYTYDPLQPFMQSAIGSEGGAPGPRAQVTDRNVLSYTSAPLSDDVVVAGPISMRLVAQTTAKDTDWVASLQDVSPDGTALPLVHGIVQARFRRSFVSPALLKPGEALDYTIDLWAIGQVFAKGHRIQVNLTSSCFPLYARNLNTGENNLTTTRSVVAQQTIFHTQARQSFIVLPTLPR